MLGTIGRVVCLTFWMLHINVVLGLKNVVLTIEPSVVQYLNKSVLRCTYELEKGESLYAVKWYRGVHEFYRYTPSEKTSKQVFPFKGATVDEINSNSTQVLLKDIEFNVSGQFSCEVTADETSIRNQEDRKSMLVVQLPDHPPEITVGREPLDYGDILRANCSSYPSRPPADLTFILNGITVHQSDPAVHRKLHSYDWSDLQLELKLSSVHFSDGRLILQCVAQVSTIYREEAELELQSSRHPVPERVSAPNSASEISASSRQTMVLRLSCCLVLLCFNSVSVIKILINTLQI